MQTLFLSALQAFYTAQATRAAVASTTEAERAAREGFAAAESRYKVGVATPADRLLAQTALSQATLNRIKAEGEARNALGTLSNAMGFMAGQELTLTPPPAVLPDRHLYAGDRGADRRGRSPPPRPQGRRSAGQGGAGQRRSGAGAGPADGERCAPDRPGSRPIASSVNGGIDRRHGQPAAVHRFQHHLQGARRRGAASTSGTPSATASGTRSRSTSGAPTRA